jgi:glycosyltransferase involved in cell wall biosynthesis
MSQGIQLASSRPELSVIVPTRGRAGLLPDLIANIKATTPPVYELMFVVDRDDRETLRVLSNQYGYEIKLLVTDGGTLPQKSNIALDVTKTPLVFIANDDVKFYEGWFAAARAKLSAGVGVVGTNDLHNPDVVEGNMATQFLITREYIERGGIDGGPLFYEGYHHNFIDTELCAVARARGAYEHAHDSIVEHIHPDWELRERDETDRAGGMMNGEADLALFEQRQALWQ